MRCMSPVRVKGGQFVPCGKCKFCMANRRADWSYRLQQELEVSSSAYFVTLTYADENLRQRGLSKRDVQLFLKKLRKYESKLEKPEGKKVSIRYYIVGEYGTRTGRAHYHALIFNASRETVERLPSIWEKGHVQVGTVGGASIHYVTKYHLNRFDNVPVGCEPSFTLMSRGNGGLGSNYVSKYRDWHRGLMQFHAVDHGHIRRLPRYYRDKIFPNKWERALHGMKMERLVLQEYWKQVDRLRATHFDPERWISDNIRHQYNSIVNKANELNYF